MSLGKFLTVDPGETTGWSIWKGQELLNSGQTPMWHFSDDVWEAATGLVQAAAPRNKDEEPSLPEQLDSIHLIVVENWALYPWIISTGALDWDECRTARLIGSLFAACRYAGWEYEQQPAKIKERAEAAGAEAYFSHPLHENRHANDAIRHGVYRNAREAGAQWTDLSAKSFALPV